MINAFLVKMITSMTDPNLKRLEYQANINNFKYQYKITRQMLTALCGEPENPMACLIASKVMTAI